MVSVEILVSCSAGVVITVQVVFRLQLENTSIDESKAQVQDDVLTIFRKFREITSWGDTVDGSCQCRDWTDA